MTKYVSPSIAYKQLENSYKVGVAVYIYGATGYGKTSIVRDFLDGKDVLWFSAKEREWDISEKNMSDAECIIFDDVQFISSDAQKEQMVKCIKNNDAWVVIIGRSQSPQWLIPLVAEGLVRVIPEKQLYMTTEDVVKMAEQNALKLTEEGAKYISEKAEGNVYAISTAIRYIKDGEDIEKAVDTIGGIFTNHLEREIIPQWDTYLQEFLMMLSVVDEFNLPLAVMITGDDQAAKMIDDAMNLGHFIYSAGEVYKIRPRLLDALRSKAVKVFGLNGYRGYMANAAHYYEMQGDIITALELYEKCEQKSNIRSLLIRNSRRHPGAGHYYELRKYYFELDEEDVENTPNLMSAMSLLYSILMNPEKSEYWYKKLEDYSNKAMGGEKREIEALLLNLDLSLPHRGSKNMQNIMKRTFKLMQSGKFTVRELSVTNNGPSAMNGGLDFCEWSKRDKLIADTIGKIVEAVTGDMGRGLIHAGMSESLFEKGTNDTEAARHSMLLNIEAEGGGKRELMFVAVAIQARIAIISGDINNAIRVVDAYEEHIRDYDNDALKRNLEAFRCRLALIMGKTDSVNEWLAKSPDDTVDFCILERYAYMTKALCYVQLGMNAEAITILTKLRYYAEEYQRTYIHMETGLLISIVSRREGGEWKELFLSTLLEIQEYQFVRIISEKGPGLLPLLKEVKKDFAEMKRADQLWFKRVIKEAETVAKKYPGFLNCAAPCPNDFSEINVKILELQAEGLSTKDIAGILYMSERNVKYHASENYKKLGAKGKVEAIQIAKSINLI